MTNSILKIEKQWEFLIHISIIDIAHLVAGYETKHIQQNQMFMKPQLCEHHNGARIVIQDFSHY